MVVGAMRTCLRGRHRPAPLTPERVLEEHRLDVELVRLELVEDQLRVVGAVVVADAGMVAADDEVRAAVVLARSEEHTSELQSLTNLVCRLLLEKKNHPRSPLNWRRASPGASAGAPPPAPLPEPRIPWTLSRARVPATRLRRTQPLCDTPVAHNP